MGVQFGRRLLAASALFIAAGVLPVTQGYAQRPTGSVAGTLTDTHSAPLANLTVTLRNLKTGALTSEKTSRGGRYRFQGLTEGEYTLAATGPEGSGEVGGIVVSPGHESRVQAVIEFSGAGLGNREAAGRDQIEPKGSAVQPSERELVQRLQKESTLTQQSVIIEASFPMASLVRLPVYGEGPSSRHPATIVSGHFVPVSVAEIVAELDPVAFDALDNSVLASRLTSAGEIRAARVEAGQAATEVLDAVHLENLPNTRDWTSYLGAARQFGAETEESPDTAVGRGAQVIVDGFQVRSAFGRHKGHNNPFVPGESAISLVHEDGVVTSSAARVSGESVSVETRRGTEHLHGQAFLFNRQRMLAAQNPALQWVRESAPGSGSTGPTFTGEPYTPSDIELGWGTGVGGVLHRPHLFWFGALDGYDRSYPAIAAVRHPDRFFAQPTNDQMQLLSAQLGLGGVDPISNGVNAYSKLLESLAGLLGPASRSSRQFSGFGRLDWSAGERNRFTFEGNARTSDSPGGGFTSAWQTYGTHSLGSTQGSSDWLVGRWEAFASPNLLTVTQGSFGRNVQSSKPERPSDFEQSLNISSWGRLPEIVVDSRDGLTIGNPARFGLGRYPDQAVYSLQQQMKWVHGNVLLNMGGEFSHEMDATTRLRNETGTYHYAAVEDFASDALVFFAFGMNGQLNPMDQHNCDQRGKPWRDATGVLHGLGYLPCYSYYSQTIGPSDWWLSTNDWAGYATSQVQPSRRTVFTLAMRWELEQLPGPISRLDNPELPLTEHLPALGIQWGPRAGFAWGSGESRWPVLRMGYGMYFSRTPNAVLETALTQTGSAKGDQSFFIRATDNLNGGGGPPFPYVLAGKPGTLVKPGAVEFAPSFRNGEVHQAELAVAETLPGRVHLEANGVVSLGRRLPVTMDANIDPTANPKTITYAVVDGNSSGPIKAPQITVPFFASWPSAGLASGLGGRLNRNFQQVSEIFSRANSTYEAMVVRLSRNGRGLSFRSRYTFGHAADWNPDESLQIGGPSVLDPIDFRQEYGVSDLDVRHAITSAVIVQPKWKLRQGVGVFANGWMLSGTGHFNSGLPYTMRTAGSLPKEFNLNGQAIVGLSTGMNGYGGDNRVYGVGRNTYRYPATWKADLRLAKRFDLGQMRQLELMAESFNLFNHQNVTQIETVGYSIEQGTLNGAMPRLSFLTGLKRGQTEFGKPLDINATDQYRHRQVQFGARMRF